MSAAEHTSVELVERLRVIKGLCEEIANRLEDEASSLTIPRNYEYDGRHTALFAIAGEIEQTMRELPGISDSEKLNERIQLLFSQIEARKRQHQEEQERNYEYRHNFRLSGLYFTSRGVIAGCDKALEWLRESLKSAGYPQQT